MYTDGAYISGRAIQEAQEAGWQLVGPAQPSASRAGLAKEYRIEAFDISITERKALCPDGKTSTNCSKLTEDRSGKVTHRFEFEFGSQCHLEYTISIVMRRVIEGQRIPTHGCAKGWWLAGRSIL